MLNKRLLKVVEDIPHIVVYETFDQFEKVGQPYTLYKDKTKGNCYLWDNVENRYYEVYSPVHTTTHEKNEYIVETCYFEQCTTSGLAYLINDSLKEGWEMYGELKTVTTPMQNGVTYIQQMVRKVKRT